jgi:cation diffusion facilitator family transporter
MLAESIHSVADTGNQALLLLGGRRSRQEADETHQFGFGRERYFWSFVVALVLFMLGSVFALYEGYEKMRHAHDHELESPVIALAILGVAIVAEGASFRTAFREADPLREGATWWEFIRRARAPELPVVLLEDFGAIVGLVIAFVAIIVAVVTGNPLYDGIGTFTIGLLLGVIAIVLVVEMKSLLIGESASRSDTEKIQAAIKGSPFVEQLIHLRTQHLGPDELLVGAKIEFDDSLDVDGLARAINVVEQRVREVVPHARPFYIEPGLELPPEPAPG